MIIKTIDVPFDEPIDPEEDGSVYYEYTAGDDTVLEENTVDDFLFDILYDSGENLSQFGLMYGNVFTGYFVWSENAESAMKDLKELVEENYGFDFTKRKYFWIVNLTACLC